MNELQVFTNPELGTVRSFTLDDAPWFVGKDVAAALGYKDTAKALKDHVDDEDKRLLRVGDLPTLKVNNFGVYVVNESGLYSLILSSKLPSAKKFKRWITSEVLPALRKRGSYGVENIQPRALTTDDFLRAAQIIALCRNERLPYVLPLIKKTGIDVSFDRLIQYNDEHEKYNTVREQVEHAQKDLTEQVARWEEQERKMTVLSTVTIEKIER